MLSCFNDPIPTYYGKNDFSSQLAFACREMLLIFYFSHSLQSFVYNTLHVEKKTFSVWCILYDFEGEETETCKLIVSHDWVTFTTNARFINRKHSKLFALYNEIFRVNFRFSTSRQTLTWIPDTFFTALLSGRISSLRDDTGAIFIDRDPHLFSVILNYLRTRDIDLKQIDIRVLRHEAEYYNISPLIKRLVLCEDLGHSSCGDVLFYGCLLPPHIPIHEGSSNPSGTESEPRSSTSSTSSQFSTCSISNINQQQAKPGSMVRVPELNSSVPAAAVPTSRHSRNSSWDRLSYSGNGSSRAAQV